MQDGDKVIVQFGNEIKIYRVDNSTGTIQINTMNALFSNIEQGSRMRLVLNMQSQDDSNSSCKDQFLDVSLNFSET